MGYCPLKKPGNGRDSKQKKNYHNPEELVRVIMLSTTPLDHVKKTLYSLIIVTA